MRKMKLMMLVAMPLAMIAVASKQAWATNMYDPGALDNCSDANCGSRIIGGTVLLSTTHAVPWVAEIEVGRGECLRLDVTTQGADLEAVLTAPNGTVYRNNDRASGDSRPLIKLNFAPQNGWYTLQLSQASGSPVNVDFTLAFGKYASGNVANCLPATSGL
jgi:hypothetical protein